MPFDFSNQSQNTKPTSQPASNYNQPNMTGNFNDPFSFANSNQPQQPNNKGKLAIIIVSSILALLVLTLGGIYAYKEYKKATTVVVPTTEGTAYELKDKLTNALQTSTFTEDLFKESFLAEDLTYVANDPIRTEFVNKVYQNMNPRLELPAGVSNADIQGLQDAFSEATELTFTITVPDWETITKSYFQTEETKEAFYKQLSSLTMTYDELINGEVSDDANSTSQEETEETETTETTETTDDTNNTTEVATVEPSETAKAEQSASDRGNLAISFFVQYMNENYEDLPKLDAKVTLPVAYDTIQISEKEAAKQWYFLSDEQLATYTFSTESFRQLFAEIIKAAKLTVYDKSWLGAVWLRSGANTEGPGEVLGQVTSYEGTLVPLKYWVTVAAPTVGMDKPYEQVRVLVKDIKLRQDAIDALLKLDAKNRGFDSSSNLELAYFEYSIENINDYPITIQSDFTLVDSMDNLISRTGTVFGIPREYTLAPGETINTCDWAITRNIETTNLAWGKSYPKTMTIARFKVLASANIEATNE